MAATRLLRHYGDAIQKMDKNPNVPQLFRNIFKNAYLPYRDPETLKSFLAIIDEFKYDHSERLGDAFEYLLSALDSQGELGQFRTPRHIIDFLVEIVDPQKSDKILDPACGTAGFLISAYKHILKSNSKKPTDLSGDKLSSDDRARLVKNISGYDISPDMIRLSLVNLYLHGFQDPRIAEYDTLTSEERWDEFADVILANPPFMTPKGGINPHKRFSVQSRRSEVLFLDYIIEHLTPTGKAGVVVPEGIHFVAQSSYTQLRRTLIEKGFLLADITLPHGVFKPYASVKTHILLIDRVLARQSKSVLFIEIENDGFSQSDTREPMAGSQLTQAKDCVFSFKSAVKGSQPWKHPISGIRAYEITKETLLSNEKAHLLGRWHDVSNRVVHRKDVPLMRLGDLCDIKDGLSPNMATPPGEFVLVVPAEERKTADHWDFEGNAVCIPLVSAAGHGKADIKRIHYQEGKFALASTMCALFVKDEKVLRPRYLHIFLNAMCTEILVPLMAGATNITMNSEQLKDVMIPIPKPTLQDEVIESHVISTKATAMIDAAKSLRDSSSDTEIVRVAERLIHETEALLKVSKKRATISIFLPS